MACGNAALLAPCRLCGGICGRVWTRNVAMTLAFGTAHFDGTCGLPADEQQSLLYRLFAAKATPDDLADDLADAMGLQK